MVETRRSAAKSASQGRKTGAAARGCAGNDAEHSASESLPQAGEEIQEDQQAAAGRRPADSEAQAAGVELKEICPRGN